MSAGLVVTKFIHRSHSKSKQGGGIAVFINESLNQFINVVSTSYDSLVWLKNDKSITVCGSDVYICGVYLPPDRSIFYRLYNCDLFYVLENEIVNIVFVIRESYCYWGRTQDNDLYLAQ